VGALVVGAGVLTVSSWPSLSFSPLHWSYEDKIEHLIAYTFLSYLAACGWGPGRTSGGSRKAGAAVVLALMVFAALEEYHQRWIPGRFVEWGDWLSDVLGILTGFFVGRWQNARPWRKRENRPECASDFCRREER